METRTHWGARNLRHESGTHRTTLSVIIPTLDAAEQLRVTLPAIGTGQDAATIAEIIVVDGGSRDETCPVARSFGAMVTETGRGRGAQLRAGAAVATAPWLFFLHADTRPDPGWSEAIASIICDSAAERAAVFRLRFDDAARAARVVERGVAWRTRALGLPYGDQGLLISRRFYETLGGYRDMPLMEDVDLVRRIGRRRIVLLEHRVTTSAARYRRAGYGPRVARNLSILTLFFLGVPPEQLVRLYG